MDKKQLMKKIADKLGRDKAIEIVSQAYNTELITTWLSHMEPNRPLPGASMNRNQLTDALVRVAEVCDLAE